MGRWQSHEIRAWLALGLGVVGAILALLQWHSSVDATRQAAKLAKFEQASAFNLEAARIVMEQGSCKAAAAREVLLVKLFPLQLRGAFTHKIVPYFDCRPPSKLTFSPAWTFNPSTGGFVPSPRTTP